MVQPTATEDPANITITSDLKQYVIEKSGIKSGSSTRNNVFTIYTTIYVKDLFGDLAYGTVNPTISNGVNYADSYDRDARTGSFDSHFTLRLIAYMDSLGSIF